MHLEKIFLFLCIASSLYSQTVGNTIYLEEANSKYFILNPISGRETYLLDNCGYIYKEWKSDYSPGLTAHVGSNGDLYRSGKILSDDFAFGGVGGIIEKYSWSGELIWTFELHSDKHHLHHDFEVLGTGNLLVIAWEFISNEKLSTLGRITTDDSVGLYSEVVYEIDPNNNFNITWEWHAIDHTVQELYPELQNFGSIANNPERLNINLNNQDHSKSEDWLHINSIDYNSELDQILLSCNSLDEIIIVDHSTTISESSSSDGGNSMQGGDILYRWGNPQNYTRDSSHIRSLSKQHDAEWVIQNEQQLNSIILFNNVLRTTQGKNYSTIYEIQLSKKGTYNYHYLGNETLQANDIVYTYNEDATEDFYSKRMSGVTRMDNGNVVICESDNGRIFELNENNEIIWEYINPVSFNILEQGEIPNANTLFNSQILLEDYFNNSIEVTTDFDRIELNPLEGCNILSSTVDHSEKYRPIVKIQGSFLNIICEENCDVRIFDSNGNSCFSLSALYKEHTVNLGDLPTGIYLLVLRSRNGIFSEQFVLTI